VERLIRLDVLRYIQQDAILGKCTCQCSKLALFDGHHLAQNSGDKIGMFLLRGLQIGEDDALLRKRLVQVDRRAAGQQHDLSTVLVGDQRFEQVLGDGR
jgi:hypothetical protein